MLLPARLHRAAVTARPQRGGRIRHHRLHLLAEPDHGQGLRHDGRFQPQRQRGHPPRVRPGAAHLAARRLGHAGRRACGRRGWPAVPAPATRGGPLLGFKRVPVTDKDTLVVPDGLQRRGHRRLGRTGGHARQHAGVEARCQQQRRRPGGADGHAPRRHPLLPDRWQQHARPAGHEPRVHRRRPAAHRRHEAVERREDAEVAGRARRGGDRGRVQGRRVADGAAVDIRTALHRLFALRRQRPRRRPCADEDRRRPERAHSCWAR